jgi:hypothetical protein
MAPAERGPGPATPAHPAPRPARGAPAPRSPPGVSITKPGWPRAIRAIESPVSKTKSVVWNASARDKQGEDKQGEDGVAAVEATVAGPGAQARNPASAAICRSSAPTSPSSTPARAAYPLTTPPSSSARASRRISRPFSRPPPTRYSTAKSPPGPSRNRGTCAGQISPTPRTTLPSASPSSEPISPCIRSIAGRVIFCTLEPGHEACSPPPCRTLSAR